MSTNDHEWIKILVSALSGMFTGLIADPIRSKIQAFFEARKMKKAVLLDMAHVSQSAMSVTEGKLEPWKFWASVDLPGFEYYWDKNRELFYMNTKLVLLRVQSQVILRLRDLVENKQENPHEAMKKLQQTLAEVTVIQQMTWRERRRLAKGKTKAD